MSGLSVVIIVIIVLCLSSHHSGCHSFDGSIIARSQLFSDICFGVVFMGKDYSNPILLYSGDNVFISTFNRIKTCTECINQTWRGEVDTKNNVENENIVVDNVHISDIWMAVWVVALHHTWLPRQEIINDLDYQHYQAPTFTV